MPLSDATEWRYITDVVGQMFSFYTVLAMGFLFALRCGAVDLSVWMAGGLGGFAMVALVRGGMDIRTAMAAAAAVGLVIGILNFLLVRLVRVPSFIATGIVAVAGTVACRHIVDSPTLAIKPGVIQPWLNSIGMARLGGLVDMVFVALLYTVVVACLLVYVACLMVRGGRPFNKTLLLLGGLSVSGMLSAVGGTIWVLKYSAAPLPVAPIGDLRVPAAAVLAGGAFLAAPGRVFLAVLSLPLSMLLATIWRQEVWLLHAGGLELQMVLMAGMFAAVQVMAAKTFGAEANEGKSSRRTPDALSVILGYGGILITASAAYASTPVSATLLHLAGVCIFAAGIFSILMSRGIINHLRARQS